MLFPGAGETTSFVTAFEKHVDKVGDSACAVDCRLGTIFMSQQAPESNGCVRLPSTVAWPWRDEYTEVGK
jgi:hypothetical protein